MPLVLASASPQRKAILEQLGIEFELRPSEVVELTEGDPREVVLQNALRKARAVEGVRVLACDTEVNVDGEVLGKPADEAEARQMIARLAGRTHEVLGGLVLRCDSGERTAIASTLVTFRALDPDEVDAYIRSGEWEGRAGGYAIQGKGAALVERIEGDFWNVVGLPVPELVRLLKTPC
ncbi:MAG TPA: Maf family protein [Thermoleophilaceae bacterium]|nr:Maf family protein [Thermoleophilaceae bacterium]